MHPLVDLARKAIETYLRTGKRLPPPPPEDMTPEMRERAGVFVSLHDARGGLRGCIGTFEPTQENVAREVIANAISAATRDPRFYPVQAEELASLDISVDVLSPPEKVQSKGDLDPKQYGVIVSCGGRRGLLLPDLEGVDSAEQQIQICCQKGGIRQGEKVDLERFRVRRYR